MSTLLYFMGKPVLEGLFWFENFQEDCDCSYHSYKYPEYKRDIAVTKEDIKSWKKEGGVFIDTPATTPEEAFEFFKSNYPEYFL